MQTYVGYGFDVNKIKAKAWLELMRKYDHDEYENFVEETKENEGEDNLEEKMLSDVESRISDISPRSEYLKDIINEGERKETDIDYIVSAYDDFLVFDSIRFAGDSPRAEYIRSADDFIRLIGRYVPTEDLSFGNLYEGSDWLDPNYCLD